MAQLKEYGPEKAKQITQKKLSKPIQPPAPKQTAKVSPIRITSRPQQNLADVAPSRPMSKIGDLRPVKSEEKYLPIQFDSKMDELGNKTIVPKVKTVFTATEPRPDKNMAKKLFYKVANARTKEQARFAYGNLNEYGKKAFWSYAQSIGKLNDVNISEDYKADREKYAGADYMQHEKVLEEHKQRIKAQTDILAPIKQQATAEFEQKKAELQKPKEPTAIMAPIPGPTISGRGISPRALPLKLTPEQQAQQKAQYQQEIQQAIENPTWKTKLSAGIASGLTAGLSEAGMTQEQRAAYRQTVAKGLPYLAGQGIGMIGGGGVGEAALRTGGKLAAQAGGRAGVELAKQAARGAIVGGTQQGVMSATEGKTPIQIAQDVALTAGLGAVADVGLNKLFGAIAKKWGNKVATPEVKQAIENETRQAVSDYATGIKGVESAQDMVKYAEQVAKDIEADRYYKRFEPKQIKKIGSIERISEYQKIPRKSVTGEYIPPAKPIQEKPTALKPPTTAETQLGGIETLQTAKKSSDTIVEAPKAKQTIINTISDPHLAKSPETPTGSTIERGFSKNIRTDKAQPDEIRQAFDEKPLSYNRLPNETTLQSAQRIMSQGYEKAKGDYFSMPFSPESAPLAKLLAREANARGDIAEARNILSHAAEKLTTSGQISQAAKILRESDPETFLMSMDKMIKNLNTEGKTRYGEKWNDVNLNESELKKISELTPGDDTAYENLMGDINARISNEIPSTAWEKLIEYRHLAMLLNPKTHIRNVVGNGIMMLMRNASENIATLGQKAFLPAEKRTLTFKVSPEAKDLATKVWQENKNDLIGTSKYSEGTFKALNREKPVFGTGKLGNTLEKIKKLNYDALSKGDEIFYRPAYIDRLARQLEAKGIKSMEDIPQSLLDTAKREADEATYKDTSELANLLNKWKNPPAGSSLGKKALGAVTEVAMPFSKTPINIAKRGIQYSPLGLINGIAEAASKKDAVKAIDDMAKGLTGTAIVSLGYYLSKLGLLTGKSDKDTDVANYDKSTGNAPFSIAGKYSYDWAQPFAAPLSMGVEFERATRNNPALQKKMQEEMQKNNFSNFSKAIQPLAQSLVEGLQASGDTVFNMSVLKNLSALLGGGTKGFVQSISEMPADFVTSLVPAVFGQAAGVIDPTVRQTYYKGEPLLTAGSTIASKIPGASFALQPKQTPYGEDVTRLKSTPARFFQQTVSPGLVANVQSGDPKVDSEIRRLQKSTGLATHFPSTLAPDLQIKGYKMTPKQFTEYQKTLGQKTAEAYKNIIGGAGYNQLSDEQKVDTLSKALTKIKKSVKAEMLQKITPKK